MSTTQVMTQSATYEDNMLGYYEVSDPEGITDFFDMPTIADLTPHPSTLIQDLLVIIFNNILNNSKVDF